MGEWYYTKAACLTARRPRLRVHFFTFTYENQLQRAHAEERAVHSLVPHAWMPILRADRGGHDGYPKALSPLRREGMTAEWLSGPVQAPE